MERNQVYKCDHCGNIIDVLHAGSCVPDCCGEPMRLLVENTTDAAKEKHVPVVEKIDGGFKVSVGSVAHPMEEKHFIEWIEILTDSGEVHRKYLKPGDAPTATFKTDAKSAVAREYCNLHGLWKA
jgi:superoxide reductase